jgi:hypothetical protein
VHSSALSVSLGNSTELSCDSDSQLLTKIAIDKINAMAIIKKVFVFFFVICYFLKKFIATKNAPAKASANFVKLISAVECTIDMTTFQS